VFESAMRSLDFDHFGSGAHKMSLADLLAAQDAVFLDVRADEERQALTLPLDGMGIPQLHIPIDQVPDRTGEIPRDRMIGVFCPTVVRSSIVYAYLLSLGYERVRIIDGGYPGVVSEFLPGKLRTHRQRAAQPVA